MPRSQRGTGAGAGGRPGIRPGRLAAVGGGAAIAAVLLWGHPWAPSFLGLAWLMHGVALGEIWRRRALPPFPAGVGRLGGLLGVAPAYGVVLGLAWVRAWPSRSDDDSPTAYLVDRWAFAHAEPEPGQAVWIGDAAEAPVRGVAHIVARPGETWPEPGGPGIVIPKGSYLVRPHGPSPVSDEAPRRVPARAILGRVWARAWPAWSRGAVRDRGPGPRRGAGAVVR
jgi:hypothetical protein